jgi:hypothetical protein
MDRKMMEECVKMMHHAMQRGAGSGGLGMGAASGMSMGTRLVPRSILSRPLAVFTLGATIGALVYKNRKGIMKSVEPATKEVVKAVAKTSESGKDFIHEQQEKLSDIIAEVKEEEEAEAKQKATEEE